MALGEIKNGTGLDEYGIYQKVLADLAGKCVVASDSNYVRFGDGTQICWGIFKFTALAFSKIAFPIAFSRRPSVSIMRFSSANNSDTKGTFVATAIDTTSFTFIASDGTNSSWLAIGRWK